MSTIRPTRFDPAVFLAKAGLGRSVNLKRTQVFFSQGDAADCVFYLESGRVKLAVVSKSGREATISLLHAGDFVGVEALAGSSELRIASAIAVSDCTALKMDRAAMTRLMCEERQFSDRLLEFLLARNMRTQADLVDQLFNSSEQRLARILLLMAEDGEPGEAEYLVPPITQQSLAEMIGTTRSRVSLFMNRFRELGFIRL